jgi:hypothetical protein
MECERALELPVMISPEIRTVAPNQIIPCRTRFLTDHETPTSTRGGFHVTTHVPLSFPIGITVAFNEEVMDLKIPKSTPGQRAAMTKAMLKQQELAKPPTELA